ncbi:hypothetical protein [Halorubrum halodurans]|uniref:hypothetical protein n=1 Tax=Halorubrum halodurans TaxID=1383851 RepID=UPI00117AEE83|nr:hypothetical protein [Halorubrum halodurans]
MTNVLSEAYSVTLPADEDTLPESIYPEKVDRLGYPLAELQKVMWETYPGVFGPSTLLKEVDYSTSACDECEGEGWYDERGDVICDDCGMMLNSTPMLVADGDFDERTSGPTAGSGSYVFFNDGSGKQAINQNSVSPEPNVQ